MCFDNHELFLVATLIILSQEGYKFKLHIDKSISTFKKYYHVDDVLN